MPYTTVTTNQAMTSTFLNTNYRDQVVSTVTSGTRPAGTEGQVIYETDTDKVLIYNGSSWVEYGRLGVWSTWTPTLTQSGTVTATVTYGSYYRIGRLIIAHCRLSATASGTANNAVTVSLPVTAAGIDQGGGSGWVYAGSSLVTGIAYIESTTTATLIDATQSTNALRLGQTGAAFAAGLASGNSVRFDLIYQAAS